MVPAACDPGPLLPIWQPRSLDGFVRRLPARPIMDIAHIQDILPALIDALAEGVMVVDRERRVVAANRSYLEIFGNRRADLVGSACTEALHHLSETGQGQKRCAACEALETAVPLRGVRQIPNRGGVMRRYDATFSPIPGSDGAGPRGRDLA